MACETPGTLPHEPPDRFRGVYERAIAGKSRKDAIRAHCLMCMGWDSTKVSQCTAHACPLHRYRLGGQNADGGDDQLAV